MVSSLYFPKAFLLFVGVFFVLAAVYAQSIPTDSVQIQPVPTAPINIQPIPAVPIDARPILTTPIRTQPVPTVPIDVQPIPTDSVDGITDKSLNKVNITRSDSMDFFMNFSGNDSENLTRYYAFTQSNISIVSANLPRANQPQKARGNLTMDNVGPVYAGPLEPQGEREDESGSANKQLLSAMKEASRMRVNSTPKVSPENKSDNEVKSEPKKSEGASIIHLPARILKWIFGMRVKS